MRGGEAELEGVVRASESDEEVDDSSSIATVRGLCVAGVERPLEQRLLESKFTSATTGTPREVDERLLLLPLLPLLLSDTDATTGDDPARECEDAAVAEEEDSGGFVLLTRSGIFDGAAPPPSGCFVRGTAMLLPERLLVGRCTRDEWGERLRLTLLGSADVRAVLERDGVAGVVMAP